MTTTNSWNHVKSTRWLKICSIGLIAANFGLPMPALAEQNQLRTPIADRDGYRNTSIQQDTQTGKFDAKEIKDKFHPSNDYDYLRGANESRRDVIGQGSDRNRQNTQDAKERDRRPIIYPR